VEDVELKATAVEYLAARIVAQLSAERLISDGNRDEIRAKVVAGKAKSHEWPVWIVKAIPRTEPEDAGA
jgi:hypothetical protein